MAASTPIHAFNEFFLLCTILFPNNWLLAHITIAATEDSSERKMNTVPREIMNPIAIITINP